MTYAFLLLAALAVITWSVWGGVTMPAISADAVDTAGMQEQVRDAADNVNSRIRASIRGLIRNQLHEAVDEALPEEE